MPRLLREAKCEFCVKSGGYMRVFICWNSAQVWSEDYGNRWVCVGAAGWARQSRNDNRRQKTQPSVCVIPFSKVFFSFTNYSADSELHLVIQHITVSHRRKKRVEMQQNFTVLISSPLSKPPYVANLSERLQNPSSEVLEQERPHQLLTLVLFFLNQRQSERLAGMELQPCQLLTQGISVLVVMHMCEGPFSPPL